MCSPSSANPPFVLDMRIGPVSNAQELEGEEDYDAIHTDDLSCDFSFARSECGDRIGEASANFIGMRDGEGFHYFDVDELNTIRVYHGKGDSDLEPLPIELRRFVQCDSFRDDSCSKCETACIKKWKREHCDFETNKKRKVS